MCTSPLHPFTLLSHPHTFKLVFFDCSKMNFNSLIAFGALFAGFSLTRPAPAPSSELVPLEHLRTIPSGWEQGRAPGAAEMLRFRIALRQENAFEFEQHLLTVSTSCSLLFSSPNMKSEEKACCVEVIYFAGFDCHPMSTSSQSSKRSRANIHVHHRSAILIIPATDST